MRTFVVEDGEEAIEAGLLLQEVGGCELGGFFLQGEMHAFVTAIVLGMARLDPFDADTQAEPPDGEFAQMEQGVSGSKRDTVVTANVGGQAALLKKPFEGGKRVVFASGRERLAAQEISAGMIGDGEWVTVLAVAQQELALIVGTPELVGKLA